MRAIFNAKVVKNFKKIAQNSLRKKSLLILEAGLKSIFLETFFKKNIKRTDDNLFLKTERINLKNIRKIFLIGIGKGSNRAVKIFEDLLLDKIYFSASIDNEGDKKLKKGIPFLGTHPILNSANIRATNKIISILKKVKKDDLILFLIFGGGSALFSLPVLPLSQMQKITKKMLNSGAKISEFNIIRKHLSYIKGGGILKTIFPARTISLIFSDVPGNDLSIIGSGLTVFDSSTKRQAQIIAKKYNLKNLPFIETPKQKKYFKNVKNILFADNKIPVFAMKKKAEEIGFKTSIISTNIQKEARVLGRQLIKKLKPNICILAAGESWVKVKGRGRGGRNQELVLASLSSLKKDQIIISCGTDGFDNTPVAGAIGDILCLQKAKNLNLDPDNFLKNNDSYGFFQKTEDFISINPCINLSDIMLLLQT